MAGQLVRRANDDTAGALALRSSDPWDSPTFRAAIADVTSVLGVDDLWTSRYFESRLGREGQPVDYLLAFPRMAAAAALRQLCKAQTSLSSEAREGWAPILRLFSVWGDGASLISTRIPTVWLEFDAPDRSDARSVIPSVSTCLVGNYRYDRPLSLPCAADDLSLARHALSTLKPDVSDDTDRCVAECFAHLPRGARWIHLSVMLGRPVNAVKLYGVFPRDSLLPFLARLGWAGDLAALAANVERFYPRDLLGDQSFVDLNLSTFRREVSCSLGLAVAQQHLAGASRGDPGRAELLARWADAGLCWPGQREAIATWLREAARDEVADGLPREARRFVDLKLVCGGLGDVTAKVYRGSRRP
jgi:hypothetical protein